LHKGITCQWSALPIHSLEGSVVVLREAVFIADTLVFVNMMQCEATTWIQLWRLEILVRSQQIIQVVRKLNVLVTWNFLAIIKTFAPLRLP
jgi:hypothetical protein